jgi:RimJ/RimL family protein N-acetyltransferase
VTPAFRELDAERDLPALRELVTSETWPHRIRPEMTEADLREEIAHGHYVAGRSLAFLIEVDGVVAGAVAAHELGAGHDDPQLDFRVRERLRGRGIGGAALAHITREVFTRFPDVLRIEAETRRDNHAMRRVLERGGYVREAVRRQAWPTPGGERFDSIGYAILRGDWDSGATTPVAWD